MKTPYGYITISIRIVLFINPNKLENHKRAQNFAKLYFAIVVREEGNFLSENTLLIQKSKFWREISLKMGTRIKCFGQQAYTSLDTKELQYLQRK